MSIKKSTFISILLIAIVLTGCTSTGAASSWAGVSVEGDVAYVAYGAGVMSVRVNNGTMLWKYPEKADNRRTFFASPTLNGDQMYIGDYAGNLYSLDASNGNENWRFEESVGGRFIASPILANDLIIAVSTDHHVYAVTTSGQSSWKFKTGQAIWSKPVVDGDRVYIASMDHKLYALNVSTGDEIWSLDIGGATVSNPSWDAGNGLLVLSTIGGEITAVRVGMPEIAWTFQCDGNVWASPVIFDGKVYIGDLSNKFYALDLQDGSLIWSVTLSAPNIGLAAILEDGLAVATEDGTVVALTTNGDKVWTRSINGELYGSLVNYGEYLLVPATRGEVLLYALDANGNDRWSLVAPK